MWTLVAISQYSVCLSQYQLFRTDRQTHDVDETDQLICTVAAAAAAELHQSIACGQQVGTRQHGPASSRQPCSG